MTLIHRIALAIGLAVLPQVARGQEATQDASTPTQDAPTPIYEQIIRDVASENAVCRKYKLPDKLAEMAECVTEVQGAKMLLNQYASSINALELSTENALFFLKARIQDATDVYMTGRPLPMPPLPGESDMKTLDRKTGYHQQSANADIAKMTAERQCVADKAKMTDTTITLRGHYEVEFAGADRQFPVLQRFTSYGAVQKAMFDMLDRYQKETDAISCAVVK